jgi:hypothetical protein
MGYVMKITCLISFIFFCLTVVGCKTDIEGNEAHKSKSKNDFVVINTIGIINREMNNYIIGQDIVSKSEGNSLIIGIRRTIPKTGNENTLFSILYDKLPLETTISSMTFNFRDDKQFSIESDFFMKLETNSFGDKAGKDSGKTNQGFCVVLDRDLIFNLKTNKLSKVEVSFETGDSEVVQIIPDNAETIANFFNSKMSSYLH